MRDSKVIQTIASLVILGAAVTIALKLHGGLLPRFNAKPHEAAGWAMAQQTLRLLKAGGQIMVITRDTSAFKNPAMDIQLASFQKELRKARVAVGTIQALEVDPLRPVAVPPGDFLEWIRRTPHGSVIVSFMGPPLLSQSQRSQLGEIKPAIIAFCAGRQAEQIDLRALLKQGLLQAAVVSRQQPLTSSITRHNLQDWFDQSFLILTPENIDQVSWPPDRQSNPQVP